MDAVGFGEMTSPLHPHTSLWKALKHPNDLELSKLGPETQKLAHFKQLCVLSISLINL
jgi:hypothetical protein